MKKLLTGIALAASCTSASATLYNIDAVLSGVDNGFGFSGFHFAGDTGLGNEPGNKDNDGNAMTGSALANFTGIAAGGTYDDVTGAFNLVLNLDIGGTVTLSNPGTGSGVLASDPFTLDVDFSAADTAQLYDTTIVFANTTVCCAGATPPPNSFDGTTMSLWGADYALPGAAVIERPKIGLDLRITVVPVPAAVWLFGTGLLGLVAVARRKAA